MALGNTNFSNDQGTGTVGADGFNGPIGSSTDPTLNSTGNVTFLRQSTGNALTAAGTNRANSLALTNAINNITTAAASTGVTLPASASVGIGGTVIVFNAGANAAQVYGAGSDTIDGVAGATGVPLTNAKRAIFICVAANAFISAQLGVVSA